MPDQLVSLVPLAHAGATWFMVGLIWFVQIVHYPLMSKVPASGFSEYSAGHQRRTTWIVAPAMLAEAGCTIALAFFPQGRGADSPVRWVGLGLLVLVWASTFAVQVPLHTRLSTGFDENVWRRLVYTNWVRTVAWTARGIIALFMLRQESMKAC